MRLCCYRKSIPRMTSSWNLWMILNSCVWSQWLVWILRITKLRSCRAFPLAHLQIGPGFWVGGWNLVAGTLEGFLADARDINPGVVQGLGRYHILEKDLELQSGHEIWHCSGRSLGSLGDKADKYLPKIFHFGWGGFCLWICVTLGQV